MHIDAEDFNVIDNAFLMKTYCRPSLQFVLLLFIGVNELFDILSTVFLPSIAKLASPSPPT
jgi:hypothetical protein